MDYKEFLKNKRIKAKPCGISVPRSLVHDMLFDFQKDLTVWALRKGRAAIFAE